MMSNKKHWTAFLPEVGRKIHETGENIISLENSINKMKIELVKLQRESEELESELLQEVKSHWKIQDIVNARLAQINYEDKI